MFRKSGRPSGSTNHQTPSRVLPMRQYPGWPRSSAKRDSMEGEAGAVVGETGGSTGAACATTRAGVTARKTMTPTARHMKLNANLRLIQTLGAETTHTLSDSGRRIRVIGHTRQNVSPESVRMQFSRPLGAVRVFNQ